MLQSVVPCLHLKEKIEKNYGQFLGERRCKEIVELEHSKKMDERNSVMFTQDFLRLQVRYNVSSSSSHSGYLIHLVRYRFFQPSSSQVTEEILEREEANMNNFRSELKEEERMASVGRCHVCLCVCVFVCVCFGCIFSHDKKKKCGSKVSFHEVLTVSMFPEKKCVECLKYDTCGLAIAASMDQDFP